MKALDLSVIHSNSAIQSVDNTEFLTAKIGTLIELKQAASIPAIPSVKFVVTKGDLTEEFESYRDLYTWAIDEKIIYDSAYGEYRDFAPEEKRACTFMEYVSEECFRLLAENEYKVENVKA